MSYASGIEYGYDEIYIGNDDYTYGLFNATNSDNKPNNSRENRLLKKIQEQSNTQQPNVFNQQPNVVNQQPNNQYPTDTRRQRIQIPFANQLFPGPYNNPKNNESREDIDELEQKNKLLLLFVFILVVVVLVQYAKLNNESNLLKFFMINNRKSPTNTESTTSTESTESEV